jgi:type IV pilus modification protein PilV
MKRQGFTLVEVLVSLGVMTIGAMALLGMQQQTTRANARARDMTMAMQLAQNVIERLKLESLAWNTVTTNPAADLGNSNLLQGVSTSGAFITLPLRQAVNAGVTRNLANAFTILGTDIVASGADAATLASIRYCASYRLTWIFSTNRAIRADVRVWWTKEAPTRSIIADFPLCADDNVSLNPGGALFESYHVVYLSTVLRPGGG